MSLSRLHFSPLAAIVVPDPSGVNALGCGFSCCAGGLEAEVELVLTSDPETSVTHLRDRNVTNE